MGCTVWDAEVVLSHYLDVCESTDVLKNRVVLELGAGAAIAAIVAAKRGGATYIILYYIILHYISLQYITLYY